MKVYLGADHAGFELKNKIRELLAYNGYEVEDIGPHTLDTDDDYPKYSYLLATKVLGEDDSKGILVCGSGQGVCMAANRVRGIRAALVWSQEMARETRRDNDSNVLCLASRFTDEATAMAIVDNLLEEDFSGEERHIRRLDELEELYG